MTASRHNKGMIKNLPITVTALRKYYTDRFEGGPRIVPQFAETRVSRLVDEKIPVHVRR